MLEVLTITLGAVCVIMFVLWMYTIRGWNHALKEWSKLLAENRDDLIKEIMSYPPSPERKDMIRRLRDMYIEGVDECRIL